jgi:hypothetical protein
MVDGELNARTTAAAATTPPAADVFSKLVADVYFLTGQNEKATARICAVSVRMVEMILSVHVAAPQRTTKVCPPPPDDLFDLRPEHREALEEIRRHRLEFGAPVMKCGRQPFNPKPG